MLHHCLKCAASVALPDGQRFNVCPECGAVQAKIGAELPAVDRPLSQLATPSRAVENDEATTADKASRSKASGIALFAWATTLICACGAALYAAVALFAATSAPQHAAAAAIACAAVIIPYVFSRALDRMTQR